MSKVTVTIGVPGSGKTTILEKYREKIDPSSYVFVSPDEIRKEKFGDTPFDPSKNVEIWEEADSRVKKALADGKDIVIDATFANIRQRREFVSFVRREGAKRVEAFFIDVPLDVAQERNRLRGEKGGRFVLPDAIEGMHRLLTEAQPGLHDGFDVIAQLNEHGDPIQTDELKERLYITEKFK